MIHLFVEKWSGYSILDKIEGGMFTCTMSSLPYISYEADEISIVIDTKMNVNFVFIGKIFREVSPA